ncbi:MAG TPA: NAD(+)/NADH kinase [Oligoflexus sp.]|uniref:NAD(+)/NADH kinase n=1 Tax=Oligoflexus sp. TaxID=1971216 RepID=UPI002D7E8F27|nr:NAD(+)/NADH kinase [Oligoflexus sp.]HET9237894.1 NAD(+)/NADH kinase [Oligoflexus sp.]
MTSALIIRKPTNLEQHQLLQAQSLVAATDPAYLQLVTRAHDEHYACLALLKESLLKHKITFQEATRGDHWPQGDFDVVIALGGDGTLITASYGLRPGYPLIGIRSSSASVGFLCAGDQSNVGDVIRRYVEGRLMYVERKRLSAQIARAAGPQESIPTPALNDFLFAAASPAATTRYHIGFQGRVESHRSSGIWIATATGSTAAIGAAGGVPMDAGDQHLQFLVRELYHRKEEGLVITHGFADPAHDDFWIENHCPAAILALDGEKQVIKINFGDVIRFTHAEPVRVAVRPNSD